MADRNSSVPEPLRSIINAASPHVPNDTRPADITLPKGWTWERVEEQRAKWSLSDDMVPVVVAPGAAVGWITIRAARLDLQTLASRPIYPARQYEEPDEDFDVMSLFGEEPDDSCTDPKGHEFVCTGTQYGGDDESYHGEGRSYCVHCGADGDA